MWNSLKRVWTRRAGVAILAGGFGSSALMKYTLACCDDNGAKMGGLKGKKKSKISSNLSPAKVVAWGMRFGNRTQPINFLDEKDICKLEFSSIVECSLDKNGTVYVRYNEGNWEKCNLNMKIKDIALCENSLYLICQNSNQLIEYQFKKEEKQFDLPNFSSMPVTSHTNSKLDYPSKDDILFENSKEFVKDFENKLNNNLVCKYEIGDSRLDKIVCNDERIFALTRNGQCYVRGNNSRGACGIGLFDESSMILNDFIEIPSKYFDSAIMDVACGKDHTLFLTENGRLFSCGADNLLQLGLGWTKTKCIECDENWTMLGKKGYNAHAIAFNKNLNGKNEFFFELPPTDEFYPRVITGPYFDDYKAIAIDCGDYHNAIIVEPLTFSNPLMRERERNNYRNDSNESDEMMIDNSDKQSEINKQMLNNDLELSDFRRVVTWGCGLKGQLGLSNLKNACEPHAITELEKYREYSDNLNQYVRIKPCDVACGKEHTVVLLKGKDTESGSMIFAFGSNNHRQVAPKKKHKKIPKPQWIEQILPNKFQVSHVTAGYYQSAAFA